MDYIEANLNRNLTLAELAEVAQFSPYHFHRVFASTTGETLNTFVKRVRLERAAARLRQNVREPIGDIAFECGFVTPSAFARSFKEQYVMTPTQWRSCNVEDRASSNTPRPTPSNQRYQVEQVGARWAVSGPSGMSTSVEIRQTSPCEVAYVRYVGPFQGSEQVFSDLYASLYAWAEPHGFVHQRAAVFAIYHDNPGLTDDDKLRVSTCIEVPENTKESGAVGRLQITGGHYAVGSFTLRSDQYEAAWNMLWSGWLPESGYEPSDGFTYERYPDATATSESMNVDICVPVRPLRGG